jgi:Ras-related C3 botulinum toxin substrate 1
MSKSPDKNSDFNAYNDNYHGSINQKWDVLSDKLSKLLTPKKEKKSVPMTEFEKLALTQSSASYESQEEKAKKEVKQKRVTSSESSSSTVTPPQISPTTPTYPAFESPRLQNQDWKYAEKINLVLIGDNDKQKSDIISAYTGETELHYSKHPKTVNFKDENIDLVLSDTANEGSLTPNAAKDADIFLLTFSLNDRSSLANIAQLANRIRNINPKAPLILVGANLDKRFGPEAASPPITYTEGTDLQKSINAISYFECDAISKKGVPILFEEAIKAVISLAKQEVKQAGEDGVTTSQSSSAGVAPPHSPLLESPMRNQDQKEDVISKRPSRRTSENKEPSANTYINRLKDSMGPKRRIGQQNPLQRSISENLLSLSTDLSEKEVIPESEEKALTKIREKVVGNCKFLANIPDEQAVALITSVCTSDKKDAKEFNNLVRPYLKDIITGVIEDLIKLNELSSANYKDLIPESGEIKYDQNQVAAMVRIATLDQVNEEKIANMAKVVEKY